MTDTRDPGEQFAEFLHREMHGGPAVEPVGPLDNTPRAPRPDYSQGQGLTASGASLGEQFAHRLRQIMQPRSMWTDL